MTIETKYIARLGQCATIINGRPVVGELSDNPIGVRPPRVRVIEGKRMSYGNQIGFDYADLDERTGLYSFEHVPDEAWTRESFDEALYNFEACFVCHLNEEDVHVAMADQSLTKKSRAIVERGRSFARYRRA